ncbi:Spx/MgsR family RNA polymerase-binding regulatory protein [Thiomicrospira microaerophila]|uniref:Spx/MgsR family RNA polymerase-binding regulatory protein n=1 Tax=Thiomicrospira microaerophila TaxID=406020 RepID=UPI0020102785|nr:Spx/MgsR family RNA polymerase-binding regulatory protein [Thiomicrospira microaerophila]UQB41387.1 Spx/MgsR family RNA polymerase-binding regulatory protein [Thiomicrospira microaerophila]
MILYGISNCDTVRKARKTLEALGHDVHFHDFRKQGLTPEIIQAWLEKADYNKLINKRSTGWKSLTDAQRLAVENQDLDLVCQHPTLIKRPILQAQNQLLIGYNPSEYQSL